ncbi:hypothetical protein FE257_003107 [Aspergillus nanangensis]|uniref:Zn(2)-C6 fungal-type domain-containing protein n=1 Tax=Aspergillus nanangensis TaxID=2582783 RepID=A0AAD4CBW8_ASPNN|nr:hypothetical protein FE257_003107 [Aspergillus nanangensis]
METPGTTPRTSSSRNITACAPCHRRKIKCDGARPECGHCLRRGLRCEPHLRMRKAGLSVGEEAALRQRVSWLEDELSQAHGISPDDMRQVPTGERVVNAALGTSPSSNVGPFQIQVPAPSDTVDKEVGDIAANVAVLSLNATGEMRFMGGTSGVLFSRLIASTVKKGLQADWGNIDEGSGLRDRDYPQDSNSSVNPVEGSKHGPEMTLPWETVSDLLETYLQWVHTMYPVFHRPRLEVLIRVVHQTPGTVSPAQRTIYYLVLAMGAWHKRHLWDEQSLPNISSADLFNLAMHWFNRILPLDGLEGLQIMCLDMGLHRHNEDWNFGPEEWDIRRRLFWVTYALDRTVCFNLGRPLTLSDDHIDALFPDPLYCLDERSIPLAIHHIHLRRIQTRIISEIYTVGRSHVLVSDTQRADILTSIQSELDHWRSELSIIYSPDDTPHSFQWYERLYFTTTASLYRATPLFPRPSGDSIRRCYEAAANAVRTYHLLLRSNEMGHSWILVSGCFLAGITVLYTLWSNDQFSQSVQIDEVTECCRMCSNVLAVLSAKWKDSGKFSDTYDSLTKITIRRLVRQLQMKPILSQESSCSVTLEPALPNDMELPLLDSLSWPQDFNFDSMLTNPDCITDVFDDVLREQWGNWEI